MFLDASPSQPVATPPRRANKLWWHRKRVAVSDASDIECLAWFAERVDRHLKAHLAEGDAVLAAVLHAWRERMVFDPTKVA